MQASEGGIKRASAKVSSTLNAAASSSLKSRRLSPSDNAASKRRDEFGAQATTEPTTNNHLLMSSRVNLHESGLHHSPCLQEKAKRQHEKEHVTWASKLPCVVTLFTLFSLVSDFNVAVPSYALSPNASYTDRMVFCVHELNELYDGTMKTVVSYAFSTVALDMSNNKVFTYTKAGSSNLMLISSLRQWVRRSTIMNLVIIGKLYLLVQFLLG